MAKQRKRKSAPRHHKPPRRPKPIKQSKRTLTVESIPSAATLFRFRLVDAESKGLTDRLFSLIKPIIWMRDKDQVKQIERASTAQEVIDLAYLAHGLGEDAWHKRMNEFGPEILPLIAKRLKATRRSIHNTDELDLVYEKLMADLRWRGDAGAELLLECFDDLNDYGKCLACVALGLLEVQASADKMWAFYNKVKSKSESHFVGALWGLVNLKDEQVNGALVELLLQKRTFFELFGFFSLAGDARAVHPLLWAADQLPVDDAAHPLTALVSVAHRIGREALIAALAEVARSNEPREEIEATADEILARPASQAQEFFALFYRGLTPGDMARLMGGIEH
jgi:hypothetical protein